MRDDFAVFVLAVGSYRLFDNRCVGTQTIDADSLWSPLGCTGLELLGIVLRNVWNRVAVRLGNEDERLWTEVKSVSMISVTLDELICDLPHSLLKALEHNFWQTIASPSDRGRDLDVCVVWQLRLDRNGRGLRQRCRDGST